jgi:hypothetical protein
LEKRESKEKGKMAKSRLNPGEKGQIAFDEPMTDDKERGSESKLYSRIQGKTRVQIECTTLRQLATQLDVATFQFNDLPCTWFGNSGHS